MENKTKTFSELWPLPAPEIVVVTGPYGCGKSTFTLGTGASPDRTLVVDFEKSQTAFADQLGFPYVDMQAELGKQYPTGYKMIDLYNHTIKTIDAKLQPGKFDVLVLDNASPLEDGHLAYVEKNPQEFGHSLNQYNSMSGLKWGDVKTKYSQNLTRWGSLVKIIFIVVHLRDKWVGNTIQKDAYGKPIQEPKGKETLDQLSSLFVWLEHGPKGIPAGKVLKCRIDRKIFIADPANPPAGVPIDYVSELNGEPGVVSVPVLPLRLPKCQWSSIREYMRKPADLTNPAPGESLTEKELNDDERLKLRAIISHNESEVANIEKMKLDAIKIQPEPFAQVKATKNTITIGDLLVEFSTSQILDAFDHKLPTTPAEMEYVLGKLREQKQEETNEKTETLSISETWTLDALCNKFGAEKIMLANQGKIPGTSEECNEVAMKLAAG